ncbi:MAG: formylmethanofuran dehydrogenase subunit A [Candidatus Lokiarchaeota archaeon]|nr:formylmethanofuran dehydrogenase subunit A [Candidatus Lokiarchaeota archaeon]
MKDDMILKNACVYDPLNGVDGEVIDICISEGKIVEKVSESAQVIDVKKRAVLPGGVDMHAHIIGSKLGMGRMMCPEDHRNNPFFLSKHTRSGVGFTMPSSYITGYLYSIMGYTTVVEPALPALKALGAWEELVDIPNLDLAMLPMFCNSVITFHYIKENDLDGLKGYIAWLLRSTGGWGVKIVNPGGTYAWAHGRNIRRIDTPVPDWDITPRDIIRGLCQTVEELGLPHTIHLHPNNLGRVGNVHTTIETLDAISDIKGFNGRESVAHLAHMSFDCLGMLEDGVPEWKYVSSGGLTFAEYFKKNRHFTVDLGQITFGPATTMTGDGPFQFALHKMTGEKWANVSVDAELPGGAGVVPYTYNPTSPANAIQWATPLEFALSIDDVWRVVMTTDHPNGGPFTKYPLVLSWLMSKKQRDLWLDKVHPIVSERSLLGELDREWSLYEVTISTRAAPSKILGLEQHKGHLGLGAAADVCVLDYYPSKVNLAENPDLILRVFGETFLTVKDGSILSKKGKIKQTHHGRVWSIRPEIDSTLYERVTEELRDLFKRWYTHSFTNYPVPDRYRREYENVIST